MADNFAVISNFLLGRGLTREQVAGILGNLKVESNYDPGAYNAREGAIGIAQWEGGRRTRLQQFAAQTGGSETSLTTQLEFLWHELTGSEISAMHALALTTTPEDAAAVFDARFERSSGAARQARVAAAVSAYSNVGPGAGDTGFTTSGGGEAFRGGGGAFAAEADPQPGVTYGIEDPNDQESLLGQAFDSLIGNPVRTIVLTGVFVIGGLALVGVGLAKSIQPAARKAFDTASALPIPV